MEKIRKIVNFLAKQYIWVALSVTILQLIAIIFPVNFIYSMGLAVVNIVMFLMLKHLVDEKIKKRGFILFKLTIPLFAMNGIGLFGKVLENLSGKTGFNPVILLFQIAVVITAIVMGVDEDQKKMFNNIYEANPFDKMKNAKYEMQKGDVQLCLNYETNEPVILPFKDRFLHMLILGPTGSGKTSQILLPLIEQDLRNEEYGVTIIEPKGDLAEKVAAMGRYRGKEVVYFNPTHQDCPYFNPLYGPEDEVLENMATTFKMLNPDSPQFFQDMNETLIRNSMKVLKRLKGNSATLLDLSTLVYNAQGQGRIMINNFAKLSGAGSTVETAKENGEIASWFITEYYNEKSKTYEHCSGLRSQIAKITSNSHLRRVLNPPNGENDVNFEKIIEEGKILAISTAQGDLRDLGRFLGYFIILNFQSAVFKRPGNENTRRPHFLYIDEFQTYSNPGFADMLTQGRSYRVASHLATQNRALMAMGGGRDGNNFVELVSTNARNVVIFPGGNSKDAKFYSDEFGEQIIRKQRKSVSRTKFNILYGFQKQGYPSESTSEEDVRESRFTHSDVIYNKFGEILYRIVSNNTVQPPGKGVVSWLPKDYNAIIDQMVIEYDLAQRGGAAYEESPESEQKIEYPEDLTSTDKSYFAKGSDFAPDLVPIINNDSKGKYTKNDENDEDDKYDDEVEIEDDDDDEESFNIVTTPPTPHKKQPIVFDIESEDLDDLI